MSAKTTSPSFSRSLQLKRALSNFRAPIAFRPASISGIRTCRVSIGCMSAACALNSNFPLPSNLLLRLRSKNLVIDDISLRGVVQNTALPVLGALTMNSKQRFMVMCMSYKSYDQSLHADGDGYNELGPILNYEEVMKEIQARAVNLPLDMLESAKNIGIPKLFLLRYFTMQGFGWGLGLAMRSCSIFRDEMMIDPWYPIKLGTKLAWDVFFGFVGAAFMKMIGIDPDLVASYLFYWMVFRAFAGFIAFNCYGDGVMNQKNKSTSEGFVDNSMFAAERSWSLIWAASFWSWIHWCGVIFFCSLLMWLNR